MTRKQERYWKVNSNILRRIIISSRVQKLFYTEEIQHQINTLSYDNNVLKHINHNLEEKNTELYKECEELKQQVQSLLNSTSWKVTKPLRKVSSLVKR